MGSYFRQYNHLITAVNTCLHIVSGDKTIPGLYQLGIRVCGAVRTVLTLLSLIFYLFQFPDLLFRFPNFFELALFMSALSGKLLLMR